MTEVINMPTKVVDSDWRDDIDPKIEYELIGGDEKGEMNYINKNAIPVKKQEVKNATTDYKTRKIGHTALFRYKDKLVA